MASSSQGPHNLAHDQSDKFKWKDELPLGIRFRPTDEELLRDYLQLKFWDLPIAPGIIKDANVYKYPPELLPKIAYGHDDGRMYFFTHLKKKDNSVTRANRGVGDVGFWKATQAQAIITKNLEKLGTKTPLGFYKYVRHENGKKVGRKQKWLMQEYRLPYKQSSDEELVLCVVYAHEKKRKTQILN